MVKSLRAAAKTIGPPVHRGPACPVCRMPEEIRQELVELRAEDPARYTLPRLTDLLRSQGYRVGDTSIGNHLRRHIG